MPKFLRLIAWVAIPAIFILATLYSSHRSQTTKNAHISIDPHVTYQTISGWEATVQSDAAENSDFPLYREELFDRAVEELGINRVRVEIKSGIENPVDYFTQHFGTDIPENVRKTRWYEIVNDNDDPNTIDPNGFQFAELNFVMEQMVLPIQKRLNARGEHLFLNFNYIDFKSSQFEHKHHPEEYAEFVLAVYLHMQSAYGFVPDAWEMILEPDHASWSPEEIAQAMISTVKRLKEAGFDPHLIAPSTANMGRAPEYFDRIMKYPSLLPYFYEFSYHRYSGVSHRNLKEIAARGSQYQVNTSMLEHIGSGYLTLHEDLKIARNSAWQQYTLYYPGTKDNGGKHFGIDLSTPGKPRITMGKRSTFLSQYFRFIRAGAVRIDADTNDRAFDPLSFTNQDGTTVLVIKAKRGGKMFVDGLPAGEYTGCYTTEKEFQTPLPHSTIRELETLTLAIPEKGVLTIYSAAKSLKQTPLNLRTAQGIRQPNL